MRPKVTTPQIRDRKGGPKLTMVTAYDYPSARIADEAGVDMILVGDSVANVVHGHETTLDIDLDTMVLHTAAVARAKPRAMVIGDLPWLSYHVSVEDTIRNAGRLVREGGAEAVKLEGGRKRIPMVSALVDTEIPVMGHIGLTPQSVHAMGGYRVQGKMVEEARNLIADAHALEEAGIFAVVLEGVPDLVADIITKELSIPTIGIGAGPGTDGQVLVYHDVLGLTYGRQPRFVRRFADLHGEAVKGIAAFRSAVESGEFPNEAETYHLDGEVADVLLKESRSD
ncbi:MAG TPA: 3-methyl-2-oxobutanoate hydroxymethyltransferase [Acidimicrobiia bacterium]|nr:3-methyl-2-oxobutanoate hydroxymethyltransferase [Acidimicrobiia bacterium]